MAQLSVLLLLERMLDLFNAIPVYLNESNVTHPSNLPPGSFVNSFSAHAHVFVRAPAVPVPACANAQNNRGPENEKTATDRPSTLCVHAPYTHICS